MTDPRTPTSDPLSAWQALLARLGGEAPVHIKQVFAAAVRDPLPERGADDCLYRGEVIEIVREALPAIEAEARRQARSGLDVDRLTKAMRMVEDAQLPMSPWNISVAYDRAGKP